MPLDDDDDADPGSDRLSIVVLSVIAPSAAAHRSSTRSA